MSFNNQQDRARATLTTEDNTPVVSAAFVIEEGSFVQFNLFVKAQSEAGDSMNLVYQGAVKRLVGGQAVLVGPVQMVSNRRDVGATWTVLPEISENTLQITIVGAQDVTISWSCSLYTDWVF